MNKYEHCEFWGTPRDLENSKSACLYIYIYTYIYLWRQTDRQTKRERERERERGRESRRYPKILKISLKDCGLLINSHLKASSICHVSAKVRAGDM